MQTNTHELSADWSSTPGETLVDGFSARTVDDVLEPEDDPRHRHFVVLPLVGLLLVLLQLCQSLMAPKGSVLAVASFSSIAAEDADTTTTFPQGAAVRLFKGSAVDSSGTNPVLTQGSALIFTKAPLTIAAGGLRISSVSGVFHLTAEQSAVTVAALTAPVLVQDVQGRSLLVPVGYQWRGTAVSDISAENAVLPLPQDFLFEQSTLSQSLSPVAPIAAKVSEPALKGVLLLPGAKSREEESSRAAERAAVLSALSNGNTQEALNLLSSMSSEDMTDPDLLTGVLSLPEKVPAVVLGPLLTHTTDRGLLLLLAAHPDFADATVPLLTGADERTWLTYALLSDDGVLAVSSAVEDAAQKAMTNILTSGFDTVESTAFLSNFVTQMSTVSMRAEARQLPERQRAIASLTEELAAGHEALLTDSAAKALQNLSHLDRPTVEVPVTVKSSAESSISSESSDSAQTADQVIAAAETMLTLTNAMRSVDTKVEAIGPHMARVTAVFYATSSGDKGVSFTFDTEKKQFNDLVIDGKPMPFPMNMESFEKWVK